MIISMTTNGGRGRQALRIKSNTPDYGCASLIISDYIQHTSSCRRSRSSSEALAQESTARKRRIADRVFGWNGELAFTLSGRGRTCDPPLSAVMISEALSTTFLFNPAILAHTRPADELATPSSNLKSGTASSSSDSGTWIVIRTALIPPLESSRRPREKISRKWVVHTTLHLLWERRCIAAVITAIPDVGAVPVLSNTKHVLHNEQVKVWGSPMQYI
jgi:hypothetical protein